MSTISQRSFAGGELTPTLHSRVDTVKYATGLKTCRNFIILRSGGATVRPGTSWLAEVKDSTKRVRLIPFEFNPDQTYVLEFGDLYMRVIHNGAYVTDLSLTITGITNANPAVVSYTGTDPVDGQEVFISGVVGAMGQFVNGRNFKIDAVNAGANTFVLQYMDSTDVDSTSFGAYASGGTAVRIYEIVTPYLEADVGTLDFVQTTDIITLVHPSYAPRELSRLAHNNWTLSVIAFHPSVEPPVPVSVTPGGAPVVRWAVTSISAITGEESLVRAPDTGFTGPTPTTGAPQTLRWTNLPNVVSYNVYRRINGIFGFVGVGLDAGGGESTFADNGVTPDITSNPPIDVLVFTGANDFPASVTIYQQRKIFARTNDQPETVWASRVGAFNNFTKYSPIRDDDAFSFVMAGRQVNEIKNLLDLGVLVVFTTTGEHSINGDAAGVLTPSDVNRKQNSYNGSQDLSPIIVDGNALYLQARGSIIRDLAFDYQVDGYRGNDLTLFASHLFDGHSIVDWAYQKTPHSIVWAVRDDGKLFGLTYIRDQQIFGWHRHDFSGTVENVAVIPEGNEDSLYVVVKRNIDGRDVKYVERMRLQLITSPEDIDDFAGMDASLSYDGRNTDANAGMTLSGGTTWDENETLTLTCGANVFTTGDVGKAVHLYDVNGVVIRFLITGFVATFQVTGKPHKIVPVTLRNTATTDWRLAIQVISGLWHLEGMQVAVFGDGFVVGSPNNSVYPVYTVVDGRVTLDRHYGVIHIGDSFIADVQTLDIDTVDGETLADKKKLISQVNARVENSRGIWAGGEPPADDDVDPLEGLNELKIRNTENYDDPVHLETGVIEIKIRNEWNSSGHVFIRQVDPLPLTLLSIDPHGLIPYRR